MMLEHISGIPNRIADLKRKLKSREGKSEYRENREHIRTEIARLEALTANREALEKSIAEEAGTVASDPVKDNIMTVGNSGAFDFFVRLRKIENAGLKARDMVALYAIRGEPGIMGRTLALKLGYASRSSVQDCVARLVKHGFITDRRVTQNQRTPNDLWITDAGVQLLADIIPS